MARSLNLESSVHFSRFRFEVLYLLQDIYFHQESADNAGPEVGSPGKDALLEEACKKYEAATQLCPTLHEVLFSLSDAILLNLTCCYSLVMYDVCFHTPDW